MRIERVDISCAFMYFQRKCFVFLNVRGFPSLFVPLRLNIPPLFCSPVEDLPWEENRRVLIRG